MSTSAPRVRAIDMLTGTKAPTEFFRALSEADERAADVNRLRRDNEMLRRELDALLETDRGELLTRIDELTAERDRLARELAELRARLIRDEWKGRGW